MVHRFPSDAENVRNEFFTITLNMGKIHWPQKKLKGNYNWCNGELLRCILIVSSNYRKRKLNVVVDGGGDRAEEDV